MQIAFRIFNLHKPCLRRRTLAFGEVQGHAGTTVRFTLPLPNAAALAGATAFLQGAAYDPLLAVSVPLATSNGLRCTVGL